MIARKVAKVIKARLLVADGKGGFIENIDHAEGRGTTAWARIAIFNVLGPAHTDATGFNAGAKFGRSVGPPAKHFDAIALTAGLRGGKGANILFGRKIIAADTIHFEVNKISRLFILPSANRSYSMNNREEFNLGKNLEIRFSNVRLDSKVGKSRNHLSLIILG